MLVPDLIVPTQTFPLMYWRQPLVKAVSKVGWHSSMVFDKLSIA